MASEQKAATKPAKSRLSVASEEALVNLVYFEDHLIALEDAVTNISIGVHQSGLPVDEAKAGLLELESQAKQLKQYGVEAVSTGNLQSGKALAKELKGNELERLEQLFKSIQGLSTEIEIKEIEALNRRSSRRLEAMYQASQAAPEPQPPSSKSPNAPQPVAASQNAKVRLYTEMINGLMKGEDLAAGLDDQTAVAAARLVTKLQKQVLTPRGMTLSAC